MSAARKKEDWSCHFPRSPIRIIRAFWARFRNGGLCPFTDTAFAGLSAAEAVFDPARVPDPSLKEIVQGSSPRSGTQYQSAQVHKINPRPGYAYRYI
jgi:hypothetical protein